MITSEINAKLEIVKLEGMRFTHSQGFYSCSGYALHHPTLGYFSFNGKTPYMPKRQALQEILAAGGLLSFHERSFVMPLPAQVAGDGLNGSEGSEEP